MYEGESLGLVPLIQLCTCICNCALLSAAFQAAISKCDWLICFSMLQKLPPSHNAGWQRVSALINLQPRRFVCMLNDMSNSGRQVACSAIGKCLLALYRFQLTDINGPVYSHTHGFGN